MGEYMKRLILSLVLVICLLAGCGAQKENYKPTASKGIWLSFSEINTMLNSEKGIKEEFEILLKNCKELQINEIYIHIRAFCDSLYPSKIFPLKQEAVGYDFDIFQYMIDRCHDENIKVHAWINPYRVSNTFTDISLLSEESPAYKWVNGEGNKNVVISNGIYLNPAESEVQQLVINGVREVITNYNVDGIHFDDYFYPTTNKEFDKASFEEYKSITKDALSLEDWRRNNVNSLISGCYNAIKYYNEKIEFSISPAASINGNYNTMYADIRAWVDGEYVDCIIPQLYFGFYYPDKQFRFENLLKDWKDLIKNSKVKLKIGLAPYKIDSDLTADKEEWSSRNDIISRQAEICYKDKRVEGFVLFSYSSVFKENSKNIKQTENLKDIIKIYG